MAPSLQEIKLEAKNVEKTNPITGKKTAYIIKIKAVIKISIIFPNSGQIGFMSGLKIRSKDEDIKKKRNNIWIRFWANMIGNKTFLYNECRKNIKKS